MGTCLAAQARQAFITTTPSTSCAVATPPIATGAQVRGFWEKKTFSEKGVGVKEKELRGDPWLSAFDLPQQLWVGIEPMSPAKPVLSQQSHLSGPCTEMIPSVLIVTIKGIETSQPSPWPELGGILCVFLYPHIHGHHPGPGSTHPHWSPSCY